MKANSPSPSQASEYAVVATAAAHTNRLSTTVTWRIVLHDPHGHDLRT